MVPSLLHSLDPGVATPGMYPVCCTFLTDTIVQEEMSFCWIITNILFSWLMVLCIFCSLQVSRVMQCM